MSDKSYALVAVIVVIGFWLTSFEPTFVLRLLETAKQSNLLGIETLFLVSERC